MPFQDPLNSGEDLTRFVFQSGHFTAQKFKRKAFEVRKGEVSVFVTSGLSSNDVWRIGFDYVGRLQGRPPKCRCDFDVGFIRECGLQITMSSASHERHANIVGWPEKEPDQVLASMKLVKALETRGIRPNIPPEALSG
jgi:hypothetical protein